MRRLALGFSLLENVFAAMMIGVVILGMSTVISTYTVNQQKTKDRPFAVNLAQQQMDEVLVKLVTQNAMVFDSAFVPCPTALNGRGRSYYLKTENVTVSQYFFNNFSLDAAPDPCSTNPYHEMTALPWTTEPAKLDTNPVPSDIQSKVYDGSGAYIKQTLFYRNRFFRAGGELMGADPSAYPSWDEIKDALKAGDANPPKYVVRMQLFGIPSVKATQSDFDIGKDITASIRLKSTAYGDDPRTPPTTCQFLIGDSSISAAGTTGPKLLDGASGRVYIRERTAAGADDPLLYPHYTSKVLVSRVYRIEDYADDGTFFVDAGKADTEIASSSLVVVGRVQRK